MSALKHSRHIICTGKLTVRSFNTITFHLTWIDSLTTATPTRGFTTGELVFYLKTKLSKQMILLHQNACSFIEYEFITYQLEHI